MKKTKIKYTRGGVNYFHITTRPVNNRAEAEAALIMERHIGRSQISNLSYEDL